MNTIIDQHFHRLDLYLERVRADAQSDNPIQGMADAAELSEIARRLYRQFQRASESRGNRLHDGERTGGKTGDHH